MRHTRLPYSDRVNPAISRVSAWSAVHLKTWFWLQLRVHDRINLAHVLGLHKKLELECVPASRGHHAI